MACPFGHAYTVPPTLPGRSRLDCAFDERDQAVLRDIVDALQSNPPETLGVLDLDSDRDDRLGVGLPAEDPTLNPAQICLVDLDVPRQPLAAGTHHRRPIAVQHRPRRLVGAQPERSLDAQRKNAVLLTVISHAAANHSVSGVRVRWKIVPAVTEV